MSGVGKGVTASSIACVLQARGLSVTALKIDPYINVDAGTMNPTEHGEVFVLREGLETDQDMGNYERFLNTNIPAINYMTTGSVYLAVIRKERNLEYKGKNVEVVPDIPLEVIRRIKNAAAAADADVTIIEIGGTVGEYQNILFLEAIRMMTGPAIMYLSSTILLTPAALMIMLSLNVKLTGFALLPLLCLCAATLYFSPRVRKYSTLAQEDLGQ